MAGVIKVRVVVTHATQTNALFYNLCIQSFTQLLHVSTSTHHTIHTVQKGHPF